MLYVEVDLTDVKWMLYVEVDLTDVKWIWPQQSKTNR